MARRREFDPTKVLQTAIELFWEKGYFDSSVDEVVKRSGVAKYGIYGTFGTKHELFKKALKEYASYCHRSIQSPIRQTDAALPEINLFFEKAVELMTEDNNRRGCLIVNTGIELGMRDDEIQRFVRDFFLETEEVMATCLTNAVDQQQIKDIPDISCLATYLVTEFRTALMLAGTGYSKQEIQAHLDISLKALH